MVWYQRLYAYAHLVAPYACMVIWLSSKMFRNPFNDDGECLVELLILSLFISSQMFQNPFTIQKG